MTTDTVQDAWGEPKAEPDRPAAELADWSRVRGALRSIAHRDGLTRTAVARRAGIPLPTLTQWYDGTYGASYANTTAKVQKYLQADDDERTQILTPPVAPGFVETPTAREMIDTLIYGQTAAEMVVVTLGAGMGKTTTANHYCDTRPNAFKVTMRPTTGGTHSMLSELALALDVTERNPARLDRAIGLRLKRNGRQTILLVDEAQNLVDKAIDQLRYFLDEYGCAIALLGNEEIFARFGKAEPKEGYGQIHRRVGKRLRRLVPLPGDVDSLLDAWQIEDADIRRVLTIIAQKPGALGQVDKTIRLANMLAAGAREPLTVGHVRHAWQNRGGAL